MMIYDLNNEVQKEALERVMKELKTIGFELDINKPGDRQKAYALACNLRIKFNHIGGLA